MTTLPFLVDKISFVATIKPSGRFSVVVSGREYEAGTLAGLRKKLKDVKALPDVALPITRIGRFGGVVDGIQSFEEVDVVRLMAGRRKFLVRETDGHEYEQTSYGAYYRRLSSGEKAKWVALIRAAEKADEALDAFRRERAINVEVEFRKLLETKMAKS